jgi:hypothetical protein
LLAIPLQNTKCKFNDLRVFFDGKEKKHEMDIYLCGINNFLNPTIKKIVIWKKISLNKSISNQIIEISPECFCSCQQRG